MTRPDRVVWDEGMLLSPQHFQQWERHMLEELRRRFALLVPHGYGFAELTFETEALVEGAFGLRSAIGILPNGLSFDAPRAAPLPARRSFRELFGPQVQTLGVHLAMPMHAAGSAAVSDAGIDGNQPTPFVRRLVKVVDDTRPGSERELAVACPNLRLLFDGEERTGYETLQMAAIRRGETGGFVLDGVGNVGQAAAPPRSGAPPRFVPPCLALGASPVLQELVGRMVAILSTRSEELAVRAQRSTTSSGVQSLWLLHTLNGALPGLLGMHRNGRAHPEKLHSELSLLAARLCTFAGREHPRDLPAYEHQDLGKTFAILDQRLTALLDLVILSRCVPVGLERKTSTLLQGRLPDKTLLDDCEFYVAVAADIPKERVEAEFPRKVKISSQDRIEDLVSLMRSGLPIRFVSKPPDEVPVEPGRTYFLLDKTGEHWAAIRESLSFAFHVPTDFIGLKIDLMAAKVDASATRT